MGDITFGGCSLSYSPQFTHLGIEATNDLSLTQTINIHIRMGKCDDIMWAEMDTELDNKCVKLCKMLYNWIKIGK